MWFPVILGVGLASLVGAGIAVLAARSRGMGRGNYRHGLIVGDSMNASPVLTRGLTSLTGIPWDNVAVSGKNSSQIVDQVASYFRPGVHDVVVVSAGGNDGNRPLSWTQGNLSRLVRLVRGHGGDVLLMGEPPFRGYRGAQAEAVRRSEQSRLWTLGGGAGTSLVLDLHRVLGDGQGSIRDQFDGGDGLHPNVAGREAMAREVARTLGYRA